MRSLASRNARSSRSAAWILAHFSLSFCRPSSSLANSQRSASRSASSPASALFAASASRRRRRSAPMRCCSSRFCRSSSARRRHASASVRRFAAASARRAPCIWEVISANRPPFRSFPGFPSPARTFPRDAFTPRVRDPCPAGAFLTSCVLAVLDGFGGRADAAIVPR